MRWLRIMTVALAAAFLWGCVEQEPDRPTAEDKRIIKENILTQAPELKFKVNADLEGNVTYLGLDVDKDVIKPGEQFKLTHYWKVHKKVDGWKIFVHLNGPSKKGFVNADHKPIGGRYPATRWKPGEIIRDQHSVTLPGSWKEPKVMVYAGLWKGKLRMKIKGPQDDENRILAATIPVGAAAVKPTPKKRLLAWRTTEPVKLDGELKEAIWSKTQSSGAFVNTMSGAAVPTKTEAKVAWDDKFLYVAFESQDEDVWTTLKDRDDKLWTQEVVEIFIDANADGKDYIELQVNPNGAIFDSYLPAYRKNQNDWNSKLKAAVKVDGTLNKREDKDKSWSVEMAIPWEDVKGKGTYELELPPKPGTIWLVNLFRFDHTKGKPPVAMGWSPPMVGDFHVLDKFGELAFADEKGQAPIPEKRAAAAPAPPPSGKKMMRIAIPKQLGRGPRRMLPLSRRNLPGPKPSRPPTPKPATK
jgi:hypothetical protein